MEHLTALLINHIEHAHFMMFGLLLLAGLNIPISEDLIVILAGMLASTMIPEKTIHLFLWVFSGCYISDLMGYSIGRLLGLRLLNIWNIGGGKSRRMVVHISRFYKKFGILTLLIGRLIPFGVRNALFASAGMSKMPFSKFCFYDSIACLSSNILIFSLGYYFGKQYPELSSYLKAWNIVIFILFVITAAIALIALRKRSLGKRLTTIES